VSQLPGAQDIFDYSVGALWKQGIDGTGTTIALIEGWDDSRINDVIKAFDQKYGLPDPQIHTIYPSGAGHLPAQCLQAMVALGSYGSCDAWQASWSSTWSSPSDRAVRQDPHHGDSGGQ
jgi:hypothetical protein